MRRMLKRFWDLPTNLKLSAGFGFCLASATGLVFLTTKRIGEGEQTAHDLFDKTVSGLADVQQITDAAGRVRAGQLELLTVTDAGDLAKIEKSITAARGSVERHLKSYATLTTDDAAKKKLTVIQDDWNRYISHGDEVMSLVKSGNKRQAGTLLRGVTDQTFAELNDQLGQLTNTQLSAGNQIVTQGDDASVSTITTAWGMLLVTGALGAILGMMISRHITRGIATVDKQLMIMANGGITEFATVLERFRNGDLTSRITVVSKELPETSSDDIGAMYKSCNYIRARMREAILAFHGAAEDLSVTIRGIQNSATSLDRTSRDLAAATEQSGSASEEVSQGSEKLAIGAQGASATMQGLADRVQQVGESSQSQYVSIAEASMELQGAVGMVSDVAKSAGVVVQIADQAHAKMDAIMEANGRISSQVALSTEKVAILDAASAKIGSIVKAIDGIADQTNLLSLNAAIEAARAGVNGRGFAVVADEVRKLAVKSSQATKEISDLVNEVRGKVTETVEAISAAVPLVEQGTQLSQDAGEVMTLIGENAKGSVRAMGDVAQIARGVATSMENIRELSDANRKLTEQMNGDTSDVSNSIQDVAAVSQETAASAQEMSASAQEVSATAQQLSQMAAELQRLSAKFVTEEKGDVAASPKPVFRKAA